MYKNKKVFKVKKTKENMVKPFNLKTDVDKDEMNDFHAILETKYNPPPKLTKHEIIFS
tara:strand:+ start:13783 stop:13956 length:174 start_codon:yes stop_codon:yes gene_type:complete